MSKFLNLDYNNTNGFINTHELEYQAPIVKILHDAIHQKTGAGSDF